MLLSASPRLEDAVAAAGAGPDVTLAGDLYGSTAGGATSGTHPRTRTAVEIGLAHGAPLNVTTEFLGALGMDAEADAGLLLDFDAEDLTDARRSFSVGGEPATPLHKATVSSWLRHVTTAMGTRPPSMLDAGFV